MKKVVAWVAVAAALLVLGMVLGTKRQVDITASQAAPADPFDGLTFSTMEDLMLTVRGMAPVGSNTSLFLNREVENGRECHLNRSINYPLPVVVCGGKEVELIDLHYSYHSYGKEPVAGDGISYAVRCGNDRIEWKEVCGGEDNSLQHAIFRTMIAGMLASRQEGTKK